MPFVLLFPEIVGLSAVSSYPAICYPVIEPEYCQTDSDNKSELKKFTKSFGDPADRKIL